MNGWIDEVTDGIVWGRLFDDASQESEFWLPVLSVLECQRVDLEPGRYCSLVNGALLIDKTVWTTHDMENADRAARSLHRQLFGPASSLSPDLKASQRPTVSSETNPTRPPSQPGRVEVARVEMTVSEFEYCTWCAPNMRDCQTPNCANRKEAVARIIDPIAFTALERSYIVPQGDEFMRMKIARDKADAILALSRNSTDE